MPPRPRPPRPRAAMGSLPHPPGVVTPPSTSPWSPGAGDSSCRGTRLARASSCGEVGPSAGSARVCSTSSSRPDRRWAPARRLRDRSRLHAGGLHCQVRRAYLPQHRCRRRSLCPGRRRHAAPEVPLPRDPMRRSAGLGGSRHLAASPRRPFWEHCVDSWTLAASSVGGTVPETPAVLRLSPVWLHRKHPHRLEPTRGGARRPSAGGAMDGYISLHDLATGSRLTQRAGPTECTALAYNAWRASSPDRSPGFPARGYFYEAMVGCHHTFSLGCGLVGSWVLERPPLPSRPTPAALCCPQSRPGPPKAARPAFHEVALSFWGVSPTIQLRQPPQGTE